MNIFVHMNILNVKMNFVKKVYLEKIIKIIKKFVLIKKLLVNFVKLIFS